MSPSIYNFNAGPAMLPREVMEQAQREFLNYQNTGMSVMEMSHRGKVFQEILDSSLASLRRLLQIPEDYSILYFPGGATLQFSAIPLNLMEPDSTADYALTGVWANKAFQEAKKYSPGVRSIFDGSPQYRELPSITDEMLSPKSKFLYLTTNNTIFGTCFNQLPSLSSHLMVADMTSELLSRPISISQFGLIFAGAQKNIGPSGITVVVVKKDWIQKKDKLPPLLDYHLMDKNGSLYNTPPTYSIYIAGLVFEWLEKKGGVPTIHIENQKKANALYTTLDNSSLFFAPVPKPYRSFMNVVFHLTKPELEASFRDFANANGMVGLEGHRDAGGFRASIYNAMPLEGVQALCQLIREFERSKG